MEIKRLILLPALLLFAILCTAQDSIDYSVYDDKCNFYIANDLGRNGYYDQSLSQN